MDLSIIIVNWNTRALLQACLESVADGLEGLDAEIIVVDNASSDGSPEMVAAGYPSVRLVRNERNAGFAAANNQAIAIARGRHLLLLNSDTVVRGEVLPQMVRYADTHQDVGALGCRVLNPDGSLQRTCFRDPSPGRLLAAALGLHHVPLLGRLGDERLRHWRRDDERDVDVVTGCCLLARRAAVEAVGPLDDQFFFYGEETDWCIRLRRAGWAVRFAPVGEIIHHGGASAVRLDARRDMLLAEAIVRLNRKHGGRVRAIVAWGLMGLRHAVRFAGWALLAGVGRRRSDAWSRARRHALVLRGLRRAWPRKILGAPSVETSGDVDVAGRGSTGPGGGGERHVERAVSSASG
ncbi:MAG: glycosyltransferase family 2 protein [Planctomycetota bacterium]|jgi:GT2 family glycosyltransferase